MEISSPRHRRGRTSRWIERRGFVFTSNGAMSDTMAECDGQRTHVHVRIWRVRLAYCLRRRQIARLLVHTLRLNCAVLPTQIQGSLSL